MKDKQLQDIDAEIPGYKVVGMDETRVRWVEKEGKRVDFAEGDDVKEKVKEIK